MRVFLSAALTGIVLATAGCSGSSCDRECLQGFMTQYLDALIAQKPGDVPVSDDMRYTENTVDIKLGEGINLSLVAEWEGKVIGFIMGAIFHGEFGIPERRANIESIGIHPDHIFELARISILTP